MSHLFGEVVNLEHLGLARELDTDVRQDRHEAFTKSLELFSRGPNLTDFHVVLVSESDVELETCRIRPLPSRFQTPQASSYFALSTLVGLKRTTMLIELSSPLGGRTP